MGKIITIGRQFGSGGREIGKRLADEMNYAYYDEELIDLVSEESGLHPEYIKKYSEAAATRDFPLSIGRTFSYSRQISPATNVHLCQARLIKKLAETSNAIFVGRCASDVLRELSPFNVFIYSTDMQARIERCYEKVPADRSKSEKEIEKMIKEIDRGRSKYFEQFTATAWMDMKNYNLCIDTGRMSIKKAVEIILHALDA